jgi:hypothetical protein
LPGILAYQSAVEGGRALSIPNLRERSAREHYRYDDFRCLRDETVRKD